MNYEVIQAMTKAQKVEMAISNAESVFGLICGEELKELSRASIDCASQWLKSPTEENRKKCAVAGVAVHTGTAFDSEELCSACYGDPLAFSDYAAHSASSSSATASAGDSSFAEECVNGAVDSALGATKRSIYAQKALIEDNKALRSRLEYAAETFDMLDEHTHANIECDAAAAACRELL